MSQAQFPTNNVQADKSKREYTLKAYPPRSERLILREVVDVTPKDKYDEPHIDIHRIEQGAVRLNEVWYIKLSFSCIYAKHCI